MLRYPTCGHLLHKRIETSGRQHTLLTQEPTSFLPATKKMASLILPVLCSKALERITPLLFFPMDQDPLPFGAVRRIPTSAPTTEIGKAQVCGQVRIFQARGELCMPKKKTAYLVSPLVWCVTRKCLYQHHNEEIIIGALLCEPSHSFPNLLSSPAESISAT